MTRIGIIGAGAWGTALGLSMERAGCDVLFWDYDPSVVERIRQTQSTDTPLKGLSLPPRIQATHHLEEVCHTDLLFLVTAAQAIRSVAQNLVPHLSPQRPVVLCSKGIEESTGILLTSLLRDFLPQNPLAVLSGPAFATEVAQGLPTMVSLACEDFQLAQSLARTLSSQSFRLCPSQDIVGVQLGGAFKNVLAIASGIFRGLKLGENAQASLMTRGLSEMRCLGEALGAHPETFSGFSGLGDMILTGMSMTSRNMTVGHLVGEGHSLESIKKSYPSLAEGVFTTKAVKILSERWHLSLPSCAFVHAILYEGMDRKQALQTWLTAPFPSPL